MQVLLPLEQIKIQLIKVTNEPQPAKEVLKLKIQKKNLLTMLKLNVMWKPHKTKTLKPNTKKLTKT